MLRIMRPRASILPRIAVVAAALAFWPASFDTARSEVAGTFPDTERAWGPVEYLRADALLRVLPPADYPRLASATSRRVFRRMVDPRNVAAVYDTGEPLLHRLINLRCYDAFIGSTRALYNLSLRAGVPVQPELVRLHEFLLELSSLTVDLTRRHTASLNPPSRQALVEMRFFDTYATLKNHVAGVIYSLRERAAYSASQRIELARAIKLHLPALLTIYSHAERRDLATTLTRLSAMADDPVLGETLAEAAALAALGSAH
jgi:hypothetical protein